MGSPRDIQRHRPTCFFLICSNCGCSLKGMADLWAPVQVSQPHGGGERKTRVFTPLKED